MLFSPPCGSFLDPPLEKEGGRRRRIREGATGRGEDEEKRWISVEKTRDGARLSTGRREGEGTPLMVKMVGCRPWGGDGVEMNAGK
jgi:hypothetical protein